MDTCRIEDMVKLVIITAKMEAETGDSEEISERCSSYSINVQILCIFCPTIITSSRGGDSMIVACSMLIDVKNLRLKNQFLTSLEQGASEAFLVQFFSIHFSV